MPFANHSKHIVFWRHPHGELEPGCDLYERPVIPSGGWRDDVFKYVPMSQDFVVAGELLYCNRGWISKNLFARGEAKCWGRCQDFDPSFPKCVLHYSTMNSSQSGVMEARASCYLYR